MIHRYFSKNTNFPNPFQNYRIIDKVNKQIKFIIITLRLKLLKFTALVNACIIVFFKDSFEFTQTIKFLLSLDCFIT